MGFELTLVCLVAKIHGSTGDNILNDTNLSWSHRGFWCSENHCCSKLLVRSDVYTSTMSSRCPWAALLTKQIPEERDSWGLSPGSIPRNWGMLFSLTELPGKSQCLPHFVILLLNGRERTESLNKVLKIFGFVSILQLKSQRVRLAGWIPGKSSQVIISFSQLNLFDILPIALGMDSLNILS